MAGGGSGPGVAVIGRIIEAYAARDMERLLEQFEPDAEWRTTPGFVWPGVYEGHEGLRTLFERWWQGWQSGGVEPAELIERDERVLVSARLSGLTSGTGEEVALTLNWIFHLNGERVARVVSYETVEDARAALDSRA